MFNSDNFSIAFYNQEMRKLVCREIEKNSLKKQKHGYLIHTWSDCARRISWNYEIKWTFLKWEGKLCRVPRVIKSTKKWKSVEGESFKHKQESSIFLLEFKCLREFFIKNKCF